MSVIEAMKLAPEALSDFDYDKRMEAITALREALAEQPAPVAKPHEQEPVEWGVDWGRSGDIPCVSIIKRLPGGGIEVVAVEYAPYEYNPPAQRKPLTVEKILHLVDTYVGAPSMSYPLDSSDWINFARAIEAAHGIKENT